MASTSPKGLLRFLPIPLLALAAWVLWRELHGLNPNAVRQAMAQWGPGRSVMAVLLAFSVYGLLAANEQVALRWAHAYVPLPIGMRNAFIAFALANTLGSASWWGAPSGPTSIAAGAWGWARWLRSRPMAH